MTGLARGVALAAGTGVALLGLAAMPDINVAQAAPGQSDVRPGQIADIHNQKQTSAKLRPTMAPATPPKTAIKTTAKPASRPKRKYRIRTRWSKGSIIKAQARCAEVLRGLDIEVVPLAPVRRNSCGNAAPVKLISIGSKPRIMLSPAPTVTCDLAAAMHLWAKRDLQPMARKHLGAPLKRIDVMSSYSCRNAYGRKNGRLSQHARANALDIRGFATTKDVTAALLEHWGPRRRNRSPVLNASRKPGSSTTAAAGRKARAYNRRIAARLVRQYQRAQRSKPKLQRRREVAIIAAAKQAARRFAKSTKLNRAATAGRTTIGRAPVSALAFGSSARPANSTANPYKANALWRSIFADSNYLGGPRRAGIPRRAARPRRGPRIRRAAFLHSVHKGACTIFGTVLGPDANYAHRHHFHVDLQKRKRGTFCR